MGKASRWFRALLGMKQPDPNLNSNPKQPKEKRRWSFVKSYREKSSTTTTNTRPPAPPPHPIHSTYDAPTSTSYIHGGGGGGGEDANKHAIAVAAATAAVAEAAVAAAQAAAAVVRLTNSGRSNSGTINVPSTPHVSREIIQGAAIVIQSHFRGYLARRALRALKGLVKLQALVRGHIMRKKTTETMRCMQAMLRAQARARSVRAYLPESPYASTSKSCPILHPGPPTPEKFEQVVRAKSINDQSQKIKRNSSNTSSRLNTMSQDRSNFGSSWSDPRMEDPMWDPQGVITSSMRTCPADDDGADKILEIDTGKPLRRRNLFETSHSGLLTSDQMSYSLTTSKDSTTHHTNQSLVSCEVIQSLKPMLLPQEIDDSHSYCTAENSPQYCSAGSQGGSSRKGPFTPTKSDGCRSLLSGCSDCPSYMAYTESAKAKMRSLSAPKQRPQYERTSSTKRYSVHGIGEHYPRSNAHKVSSMHASFTGKAYPGSGRLDRLGMPVRDSTVVYYSGYLN